MGNLLTPTDQNEEMIRIRKITNANPLRRSYTDKKEKKCSEDSEMQQEIVHDTTRTLEKHELICEVSRTLSCFISDSPLRVHFLSDSVLTIGRNCYVQYLSTFLFFRVMMTKVRLY